VTNTGWGDFVFKDGYERLTLPDLEGCIAKYHHLPNTPGTDKVETAGSFELGETSINQQVKIEEIFLHLIDLEAETKTLEAVLFLNETLERRRIK
jgi:hypothetical protein